LAQEFWLFGKFFYLSHYSPDNPGIAIKAFST